MPDYVDIIVDATPDVVEIVVQQPPAIVEVVNEQVIERVVEVEPFTKTLSGYTATIAKSEHHLDVVRGLRVCKPSGELVEVAETYSGTTVLIESNVLLDNHVITIY